MNGWSDEEKASFHRLTERFGAIPIPASLERLPAEAVRDVCLNLAKTLDGDVSVLSLQARLLVAMAVAYAQGSPAWTDWLRRVATHRQVESALVDAACALAVTCSTYNGYYKFRSFVQEGPWSSFPVGLRATPFVRSVLEKRLVELICVAVSVQNGCAHCVQGHVQSARQEGASDAMVDEVVRIGAVMGALAALS